MEELSPDFFGYVCGFVFWSGLQDKPLDILPTKVILRVSFLLVLLALVKLHKEYTNEEVQEKERPNHYEDHKKDHVVKFVFF